MHLHYQVDHILPRGDRLIACFIRLMIIYLCSTRGALGLLPPQCAVMHLLYPYYIILYYIIFFILYYIILYFNSPRRIKSEDFLQFIFFHSPHRPKPKDFLQLILLIFYFEYPLKTWGNPFFTTYRSLHKPKPKDFLQLI